MNNLYDFHYSKEERLKELPPDIAQKKEQRVKGLWGNIKKNKGLMITFIDLIFILVLVGIIYPFIRSDNKSRVIEGYEVSLSGMVYDSNVLISLKFQLKDEDMEDLSLNEITLYLNDDEQIPAEIVLSKENTEKIIRSVLPYQEGEEYINARIIYNNKEYLLSSPLNFE